MQSEVSRAKTTQDIERMHEHALGQSNQQAREDRMGALASPNFESYRQDFSARPADLSNKRYGDEVTDLSAHNDVVSVTVAPAENILAGEPPRRSKSSGIKMHLWLVSPDDVLSALEEGEAGQGTHRGRLAHTNLSGGRLAHSGGELWFNDAKRIWLTGGSSRYHPRSKEELASIVEAFRNSGYAVCSCGWDDETGPRRFFRGHEEWLEPHG